MNGRIHGRVFLEGALVEANLTLESGVLTTIDPGPPRRGAEPMGGVILPGFVDLHVHGAAGADFMDGTVEAAAAVAAAHARSGTTALAATTLSGSRQAIAAAVRAAATLARDRSAARPAGAEIVAIHLEGPYLAPARAGAQDPESIRRPDPAEVEEWLAAAGDLPVLMTVAPERPGVPELIDRFHQRVRFAIGHTDATFEQAMDALARGASHFTHLFNAMPPLHHRQPGPVGAAFASARATAELIADTVHVHPALLGMAARSLGRRLCLITDAIRACGMPDGTYALYHHPVTVADGEARLADGTLAGSLLTMMAAVRNMVLRAGMPLEAVVPLATEVPARVLGLECKGRIAPGADADLVVVSERLEVAKVFVAGEELPT